MRDRRYTITQEYTGAATRQHVLRFCNDFVSTHRTRDQAAAAQERHAEERSAQLAGWMQPTLPGGTPL